MPEVSSHCDAYWVQLANWGWLPGEPLNWLECSVPDFSDMKYQTCCFMYACGNQQQCDGCFCGSQKVLKSLFYLHLWSAVFHDCESVIRNVVSMEAWSFVPMNTVLTLHNSWLFFSSFILSEAFAVKTAALAVQSTTEYISVIVLTLCSPCCLSTAQKQSCVCWIYAKRRTLLQFWQSYEGLCLLFSPLSNSLIKEKLPTSMILWR